MEFLESCKRSGLTLTLLFMSFMSLSSYPVMWNISTSRHITRLVELLPCELPHEGTFSCSRLDIGRPLYVLRKGEAIEQVGVCLFTKEMRSTLDEVVCNAIERLWLELALCDDIDMQKRILYEYRCKFVFNGFTLGTMQFPILKEALRAITPQALLSMEKNEGRITFRIETGSDTLIITLPAERELLFGCDKKEHEDILVYELQHWNDEYIAGTNPKMDELVSLGGSIYMLPGSAYITDSLRNDIFYHVQSNQINVLLDSNYPEYSIRNVLMGYVALDRVVLDMKCHVYDREGKYCMKPMKNFLSYMQKQGLQFYTATIESEEQGLRGILLMYHPIYDYVHILIAGNNVKLFDSGEVTLKCDFHTFIPQHNIKRLFNY